MSPGFNRLLAGGAFTIYALAGAAAFAAQPARVMAQDDEHEVVVERIGPGGERRVTIKREGQPPMVIEPGSHGKGPHVFRHGVGGKREVVVIRHGGERSAERLRALLQLKPSQEAALKAYLAAQEPPEHDEFIKLAAPGEDERTTLQRLADQEKRLNEHHARMLARVNATRTFYGQLEPSQQKAFDQMPSLMGEPHFGAMPFEAPVMKRVMMHMPMVEGFEMPPMPPMPPLPPTPPRP